MGIEYFTIRYGKTNKREQGHYFQDKIIQSGLMDKESYYVWLAERLNIYRRDCHFSRMNSSLITKAILISVEYLNEATNQRLTDYSKFILIEQTDHLNKLSHIPKKINES